MDGLQALRRYNYERMFDSIEPLKPLKGAQILEVGSARGWFLAAAKQRGASARGVEPEAANANLARAAGHQVDIGYFPDDLTAGGHHDIIVFNDVFERVVMTPTLILFSGNWRDGVKAFWYLLKLRI